MGLPVDDARADHRRALRESDARPLLELGSAEHDQLDGLGALRGAASLPHHDRLARAEARGAHRARRRRHLDRVRRPRDRRSRRARPGKRGGERDAHRESLMRFAALGLSHKTAPIDLRERFAQQTSDLPKVLSEILKLPNISEACIISTCNRIELYVTGPAENAALSRSLKSYLQAISSKPPAELDQHLYQHEGPAALK